MPKYIAFLRAINVGGHIVKMEHLRSLFESLGFTNVETFIASGNVIFDSKSKNIEALENKIESHLHESLGYEVATFIRTKEEIKNIAEHKPFSAAEMEAAAALNVAFLKDSLSEDAGKALMKLKTDIDDFSVNGREVYWLCKLKQSDSKFSNAVFEKTLKAKATFRGINTIKRMAAKYSGNV